MSATRSTERLLADDVIRHEQVLDHRQLGFGRERRELERRADVARPRREDAGDRSGRVRVVVARGSAKPDARSMRFGDRRPRDRDLERVAPLNRCFDDLRARDDRPLHRARAEAHRADRVAGLAGVERDLVCRRRAARRRERNDERRVIFAVAELAGPDERVVERFAADVDFLVVVLERDREARLRRSADRLTRRKADRPLAEDAVELHGAVLRRRREVERIGRRRGRAVFIARLQEPDAAAAVEDVLAEAAVRLVDVFGRLGLVGSPPPHPTPIEPIVNEAASKKPTRCMRPPFYVAALEDVDRRRAINPSPAPTSARDRARRSVDAAKV